MSAAIEAVPFDPGNEHHCAFLFDSVMAKEDSGARWPYERYSPQEVRDRLEEAVGMPSTDCIVGLVSVERGAGAKPAIVGLAAVNRGVVVTAYTRFKARRNGYAYHLLGLLGVDTCARPTPVLFWSPAASRIAAGGKHMVYPMAIDDWLTWRKK